MDLDSRASLKQNPASIVTCQMKDSSGPIIHAKGTDPSVVIVCVRGVSELFAHCELVLFQNDIVMSTGLKSNSVLAQGARH